jgi:hypothetical protein
MTTVKDFWIRQSEGYDFIMDTDEHVHIAVHGSEEERALAVERYMEACRLNYMSVSEAVAWWRFTAPTEEMYQACLPVIREAEVAAAAAASAMEIEEEPYDDIETLVLDRYGDLECPACGLQYVIFCFSSEPKEPCSLCNPQYIMDFKQWLADED